MGGCSEGKGHKRKKTLAAVLVLTLWTNRVIPLFDLSDLDGSDAASMEWR